MKHIDIKSIPSYVPRLRPINKINERLQYEKSKKIVHLCCMEFGITYEELTGGSRKREITEKKQITTFIAKDLTKIGCSSLARLLNDDHANVYWMYSRIESAFNNEPALKNAISSLKVKIINAL